MQVNTKAGMTFQSGLRSVLRQDPDIVLVGEVRDAETAELALKAALTGHLVLTTLHTNSAAAALTRLVDMGFDPFLVASSLSLAVAQRLVRGPATSAASRTCPTTTCWRLLGLRVDDIARRDPAARHGLPDCGGTGYRGRTAVYEVLEVDAAMRSILLGADRARRPRPGQGRRHGDPARLGAGQGHGGRDHVRGGGARHPRATTGRAARARPATAPVEHDMLTCPWCAARPASAARCRGCDKELEPDWEVCPWCRDLPHGATGPGSRARPGRGTYPGGVTRPPTAPPTPDAVRTALASVEDPEIRRPITELGMVKDVEVGPRRHGPRCAMYLTVAGCPMKDTLTTDVTAAVARPARRRRGDRSSWTS